MAPGEAEPSARDGVAPALPCRQCGGTSLANLGPLPPGDTFAGRPLEPPWSGGDLVRCGHCRLVFRAPVLEERAYEAHYAQAPDSVWTSDRPRGDRKPVLDLIARHAPTARDILDLGCYDGSLLDRIDLPVRKYGVEASRAAADVARDRGIEIVATALRELPTIAARFDIVMAIDVMEHVLDPSAFLLEMLRLTRPGGLVLVSTGNADAWPFRLAGATYWYSAIAEHLSFVSDSWMRDFAGRHGVEILALERFRYYDEPAVHRSSAALAFTVAAIKRRLRRRLFGWLGREDTPASWHLAGPGMFEDHFVIALRKP